MRDFSELIARLKQSDDNCNAECCECSGECLSSGCNIFSEAADAIEELLATVPHWISVEERLPEVDERVLACVGIPGELSVWDGVRWNGEEWEAEEEAAYDYWTTIDDPVTHWMPLPAPPKEVQDG